MIPFQETLVISRPVLGVLLALVGCATAAPVAETPVGPSPCEYYALAVGNRWTYDGPPGADGRPEPIQVTIASNRDGFFQDDKGGSLSCGPDGLRDGKQGLSQVAAPEGRHLDQRGGGELDGDLRGNRCRVAGGCAGGDLPEHGHRARAEPHRRQEDLINETTFTQGVGIIRFATSLDEQGDVIPESPQASGASNPPLARLPAP